MARTFNGSTSKITMAAGVVPDASAAFTWVAVLRVGATFGFQSPLVVAHSSAVSSGINVYSSGLEASINNSSYSPATSIPLGLGKTYLVAVSKTSGFGYIRFSAYDYSTDTWTRVNSSSQSGASGNPVVGVIAGCRSDDTGFFTGDLAAGALYGSALSDDQLGSMAFSLPTWLALSPKAMFLFDQSSITQSVIDLTGGGANQTAITGTTVSANSVPILNYGHPVLLATHAAAPVQTGAVAMTAASSLTVKGLAYNPAAPYPVGIPQSFGFTTSGTTITYTGGGATGTGVYDVLFVNSDNTVATPAGWTPVEQEVSNQGAYVFTKAGGSTTATINLGGGISTNTNVNWVRIANANAVDIAVGAQANASIGGTTPALTTPGLAQTNELSLAFAALHSFTALPAGQTWSTGYSELTSGSSTAGGSTTAVYGSVAMKSPAGTAAESPSMTWSNGAFERYLQVITFTAAPTGGTQNGAAALTAGSSMTVAGIATTAGAVAMSAASTLTVAATVATSGAVAMTATSALTAAAVPVRLGAVAMTAGSSLSAAGTVATTGTVAMSAASNLTAAATPLRLGAVAMTAGSGLTAAASAIVGAASTMSSASSLTVTAVRAQPAAVAMSAASTLTADTSGATSGSATLSAASGLNATAAVTAVGSAAMTAGSSLTAAGTVVKPGAVAMTSVSSLTASATVATSAAVTMTAGTSLTVTGTLAPGGGVTMTAGSALTADARLVALAAVVMSAQSVLSASAGGNATGAASMTAGTSLTAGAVRQANAAVILTAISTLAATAGASGGAGAQLSAGSNLTAGASYTGRATVSLTAISQVVAGVLTTIGAQAAMSAASNLGATVGTTRRPGVLIAGSTRTAPTAGTVAYPRLTAGTLRGPTYPSGG